MKKFWIGVPSLTRLSFVWIIASNFAFAEEISTTPNSVTDKPSPSATSPTTSEEATVTATTVTVTTEPNPQSSPVVQLRQGDTLKILEKNSTYAKVEYKIEGDFPVQGWIPIQALSLNTLAQVAAPKTQPYAPKLDEEKIQTHIENFPDKALTDKAPAATFEKNNDRPQLAVKSIARNFYPWKFEFQAGFGYSNWDETYKTKNANTGQSYAGNFLKYSMSGMALGTQANAAYDFPELFWLGAQLRYKFVYFSDSIGSNTNINSGNVQAQMHEVFLGPFIRQSYTFKENFIFEPELRLLGATQFFVSNQLASRTQSQPVIFSFMSYFIKTEFSPKLKYRLYSLTPSIGMLFFYNFSESPTTSGATDAQSLRTGSPTVSQFLLSYAATFSYALEKLDFPNSEVYVSYAYTDYSRTYSGAGNRAGIKTLDAENKTSSTDISLGFKQNF
ncbi:MAG: hypothetical protein J0L93_09920 [Deltaproteobacteria bacterium]|nr:hypothetical protein [Deltaproteobacteria bacterium]